MKGIRKLYPVVSVLVLLLSMADLSFAEPKKVGVIEAFQGGVVLKNNGVWGELPRVGTVLYHGDKIVTRPDGACQVRFHDGARLKIRQNSSVRLAELIRASASGRDLERQREIRLFVGKLNYKSDKRSPVQTKLVSPTAVAALRGTEADFGTDGILAMLDQIEGESELAGDVAKTDTVADIDPKTAAGNPDYKASGAADRVRREYLKSVRGLLSPRSGKAGPILLSYNSDDPLLLAQLLSQNGGDNGDVQLANKVLVLAALYVMADANALMIENKMLFDNPDKTVRDRALKAFEDSQKSLVLARKTLQAAKETAQQINTLINKAMSGDPDQIREAVEEVKPVLEKMVQTQRTANRQALGDGYESNAHTAGYDDSILDSEEGAEQNAEEQAEEFISQVRVGRLVAYFLEAIERGEPLALPDFDEMGEDEDGETQEEEPPDMVDYHETNRDKFQEEREPGNTKDIDGDGIPDVIDDDPVRPYGQ